MMTIGSYLVILLACIIVIAKFSQEFWETLHDISPFAYGAIGCAASIGLSILGAAWGIFTAGASIAGASVQAPHIRAKNLISIIFCEAVAIYGIIMAIIQCSKMEHSDRMFLMTQSGVILHDQTKISGYLIFCSGLTIGLGSLACGVSIGILGSACAIGDAANSNLFIKFLIMEIFASAFGIFALIVSILQVQGAKF